MRRDEMRADEIRREKHEKNKKKSEDRIERTQYVEA